MMIPFKNRVIDYKKPVRIFRNLTRKNVCYSIQQNGKTVAHTYEIHLTNCRFYVNQKARLRIIKNKRKEVHAYVEGIICNIFSFNLGRKNIYYNPYKYENFVDSNLNIINESNYVTLDNSGVKININ